MYYYFKHSSKTQFLSLILSKLLKLYGFVQVSSQTCPSQVENFENKLKAMKNLNSILRKDLN